jgi:hypothetical protein
MDVLTLRDGKVSIVRGLIANQANQVVSYRRGLSGALLSMGTGSSGAFSQKTSTT